MTLKEFDSLIPRGARINVYGLDQYGELICDSTWDAFDDFEYDYMTALCDFMKEYGDCEVINVFIDDEGFFAAHIRY